jgi:hypothetical protein
MGIDAHPLDAFQPGMRNALEKLQWASTHATTVPEDTMDSLSCIFGVSKYLQIMARICNTRSGGSCGKVKRHLLSTGSDDPPSSIVVFQLISRHTQLRHATHHLYLKMRSRQPSRRCKILWLRDWLRDS